MSTTDQAWIVIEREHGIPLSVGPYPTEAAADKAMDSLLIDGFCETDCLDCYTVTGRPLDECESVIPDLNDPHHTGTSS